MLNPEKFTEAVKNETKTDQFLNDPAAKLATDIQMTSFRKDQEPLLKETGQLYTLDSEYGRLLYEKRKQAKDLQYPDANSTMRLTYGKIGSINPSDGIYYSAQSTTQGILDKYNPNDYDFALMKKL